MAARCVIGWKDHLAGATLSGGSWSTTFPLANLASDRLRLPARTTNADATSSIVKANLGAARSIRAISLHAGNPTATATVRVRASTTEGGLTSAPVEVTGGFVNYWTSPHTPTTTADYPRQWIYIAASAQAYQWWQIEISDTSHTDGYVAVGRAALWECWQPLINMSYGARMGVEPTSVVNESVRLALYAERRPSRRTYQMQLEHLTGAEAQQALDIVRYLDITRMGLWVPDEDETGDYIRRAWPFSLAQGTALEVPYFDRERIALDLREWVA